MHREVIGRRNGDLKSPLRNIAPFAKRWQTSVFYALR